MRNLFQSGSFTLASGEASWFKIDCDALADQDLWTLGLMIEKSTDYGVVEGVPRGGLRLALTLRTLRDARNPPSVGRLLIVDDIYTTGASMERQRDGREAAGYVIFARKPITQPWIRAIFQLTTPILSTCP